MRYLLDKFIIGISYEENDIIKEAIENKPEEKKGYTLKLNSSTIKWEYVENNNIKGTENNPIDFEEGILLINSNYYNYNSIKYNYRGINKISESWELCKEEMIIE